MYKIKKNSRTLEDGTKITTYSREVESCNILEVEAGTTGHGGRTYFRIQNAANTDMEVHSYTDRYNDYVFGEECGVEITLGGDCELETMIQALKFIVKVLEDESK